MRVVSVALANVEVLMRVVALAVSAATGREEGQGADKAE